MSTIVAALDASAAARPVLEAARRLAELTGATVEAVHVRDRSTDTPPTFAERAGVPILLLDPPVEPALLDALAAPGVVACVLGARGTPGGRRPVGHTALHVLEHADKPIMVVPPEVVSPNPFRRLLLPLEGTAESSRPVLDVLCPLLVHDVELIVLHAFTEDTLPRFLDRPGRDLQMLGAEFLARYCPDAGRIVLHTGPAGPRVAEVSDDQHVDLVVLSWAQDASGGRAAVVRDVLARSTTPVLLLPVGTSRSPCP